MKQEAEVQAPNHELSDMSRQASRIAQMIKRKINSGEQMDDRDYNQLAELGSVLSRLGASFGPKSMKDVMAHMKQYTNDRNEEGHNYPEFNTNRFKELLAMAK
jgi:Zn-dependent oligopeptidase